MCGELVERGGVVITDLDFDIPDGLFDATLIALVLPKQIFLALEVLGDAICGVGQVGFCQKCSPVGSMAAMATSTAAPRQQKAFSSEAVLVIDHHET